MTADSNQWVFNGSKSHEPSNRDKQEETGVLHVVGRESVLLIHCFYCAKGPKNHGRVLLKERHRILHPILHSAVAGEVGWNKHWNNSTRRL